MANKDIVNIEWEGLEELRREFKNMSSEFEKEMIKEMSKFGTFVEGKAKDLAPYDTGDLEQSISFGKAKQQGNSFVVDGGSNLVYAARIHELPESANWGPATTAKPSWRGYQPGRKYLENAVRGSESDFDSMQLRVLNIITGGGRF